MRAMRTALRWSGAQPVRIFSVTGAPRRATVASQDRGDETFVAQQRRAGIFIADFFRRTTHVDVNDLRPGVDVATRGVRHECRVAACDLHDARSGLTGMIAATARLGRFPKAWIGREHFTGGQCCAEPPAKPAKWQVGHTGHGRQQRVAL